LSTSKKPESAKIIQYHDPTAKLGKVMAPSFSDRLRSTRPSTWIVDPAEAFAVGAHALRIVDP